MTSPKKKLGSKAPQSLRHIFLAPFILAVCGLTGLILGLTGDGWRDIAAWILLGLPLLFFVKHWRARS